MSSTVLQSNRITIVYNHIQIYELKSYIIEIQRFSAKEVVIV